MRRAGIQKAHPAGAECSTGKVFLFQKLHGGDVVHAQADEAAFKKRLVQAVRCTEAHPLLRTDAQIARQGGDAAASVATHGAAPSIAVEVVHRKIHPGVGIPGQNDKPVRTDTVAAMAHPLHEFLTGVERLRPRVDHHKIVPGSLVFVKGDIHGGIFSVFGVGKGRYYSLNGKTGRCLFFPRETGFVLFFGTRQEAPRPTRGEKLHFPLCVQRAAFPIFS